MEVVAADMAVETTEEATAIGRAVVVVAAATSKFQTFLT